MARFVRSVVAAAIAGSLAGACGSSGAETPVSPGDRPGGTVAVSPEPATPTPAATPTARPTEVPGPPSLTLRGAASGAVQGELGSFLWDGLGSDAPWILPTAASRVAGGGRLEVAASPPATWDRWTARWAPVAGGTPGSPTATAEGGAGAMLLAAPSRPGGWALALEVSFGAGRGGTWYWRFDVDR